MFGSGFCEMSGHILQATDEFRKQGYRAIGARWVTVEEVDPKLPIHDDLVKKYAGGSDIDLRKNYDVYTIRANWRFATKAWNANESGAPYLKNADDN